MATATATPAIVDEKVYVFKARIEGLSPLLMSHPRGMEKDEDEEGAFIKSSREKDAKPTHAEEAEGRVYRDPFGALYVPVLAIGRALVEAGKQFQDPNYKRATLAKAIAAGVYLPEYEGFTLTRDGDPIIDYEVDTRRAVNKTTKGAILVSRPRVPTPWELTAEFEVDTTFFRPDVLAKVLNTAGRKIGVLAFRPEKLGPFGRFKVVDYGTEGLDA